MAERVPPTPLPRDEPKLAEAKPEPINPETSIILYQHETYIVQFPKDQIFHVPPPENARLVKLHCAQRNQKKKKSPYLPSFWWFVGITLTIAVLLLIGTILIFHLIMSPEPPTFTVERLAIQALHNLKLEYKISLKATNASARMGITYESGGEAVLSSQRKDIATGEPPAYKLPDPNRDAAVLNLVLHGSKHVLPTEVKRSLNGSKDVISLSLSVKLPMTTSIGALSWTKNMAIECKVRATALAKKARVVWQQCETKLQ